MQLHHQLRTPVQIARTAVVTQPAPQAHHLVAAGSSQVGHGGTTLEEFGEVAHDRDHLRLLQHDLGEPHPVGVLGVLPRQGVAPMLALPSHHLGGKVASRHTQAITTSTAEAAAATAMSLAASWAAIR